jgi:hypothetical protein
VEREDWILVVVGAAALIAGALLHRQATAVALVGFGAGLLALGVLANRVRKFKLSAAGLEGELAAKVARRAAEKGGSPEQVGRAVRSAILAAQAWSELAAKAQANRDTHDQHRAARNRAVHTRSWPSGADGGQGYDGATVQAWTEEVVDQALENDKSPES